MAARPPPTCTFTTLTANLWDEPLHFVITNNYFMTNCCKLTLILFTSSVKFESTATSMLCKCQRLLYYVLYNNSLYFLNKHFQMKLIPAVSFLTHLFWIIDLLYIIIIIIEYCMYKQTLYNSLTDTQRMTSRSPDTNTALTSGNNRDTSFQDLQAAADRISFIAVFTENKIRKITWTFLSLQLFTHGIGYKWETIQSNRA